MCTSAHSAEENLSWSQAFLTLSKSLIFFGANQSSLLQVTAEAARHGPVWPSRALCSPGWEQHNLTRDKVFAQPSELASWPTHHSPAPPPAPYLPAYQPRSRHPGISHTAALPHPDLPGTDGWTTLSCATPQSPQLSPNIIKGPLGCGKHPSTC